MAARGFPPEAGAAELDGGPGRAGGGGSLAPLPGAGEAST